MGKERKGCGGEKRAQMKTEKGVEEVKRYQLRQEETEMFTEWSSQKGCVTGRRGTDSTEGENVMFRERGDPEIARWEMEKYLLKIRLTDAQSR